MNYRDIFLWIFAVIGIITALTKLFEALGKFFDTLAVFLTKVKIHVYYPIMVRIDKRKHKNYIEEYLNNLLFRYPIEWPLAIGNVKIEWSNEESVDVDLEENILIVRVEYARKVEEVLAKVAFLSAPYLVSEYLEPALGEDFSRLVSIGVIENILQPYPLILSRFRKLINEVYEKDDGYKGILSMITKADDISYYKHIFLFELRKILSRFGTKIDKDKFIHELKELLSVIANLDSINVPKVCGYYVSLTIVRAGRLEKVALQYWEPYIQYIEKVRQDCPNLQRVYVVSAGNFTSKTAKKLIEYMMNRLPNLSLLNKFEYKARYYKGRPNFPSMVVVMEFK